MLLSSEQPECLLCHGGRLRQFSSTLIQCDESLIGVLEGLYGHRLGEEGAGARESLLSGGRCMCAEIWGNKFTL